MNRVSTLLLAAALFAGPTASLAEKIDPVTHDVIPEPDDALYNKAPDPLPWIPEEMITESYWVSQMDEPDDVILKTPEILAMNQKFRSFISQDDPFANLPEERKPDLVHWWPGHSLSTPDLSGYDRAAVADTVRVRIRAEIDYLTAKDFGNCLAVKYNQDDLDGFQKEMAFDAVPDRVAVRHGITVKPSRLRNIPTFFELYPGLSQSRKTRWDLWNIGVVKMGRPVQVLHVSKTGAFLFVLSDCGYGWIRAENIAFGKAAEINDYIGTTDFAVATSSRTMIFADPSCTISSGWFGLGTRLPVTFKGDPIQVLMPVRNADGSFATQTAWIKNDDDASVGYVPYTRRNIVHIAMKMLGEPYDWTGAWFGRQHETMYTDLFSCFGFELPNHGTLFTYYNENNTRVLTPDMGKEKYYAAINENPQFITLQSCGGHCQLYFGNLNGTPIVFDQHGYGYPDENDVWWEVRRCNIGDPRLPRYFLTKEVTFLELR